ncbi:FHA domain-containing protein [Acaryochloris marina]|uniref:FHA domain containing protein n=1 Tax=Acaryochloris marina (strain MBIC 11017) TaxID=329726 RepID=B0C6U1_ACAM1|nr:FHA domain-containing protein [Acaryochloris marina]ABW27645.1 FHA domain containing protein [Acaryochloris marina MBIC11017]BDM82380.1 FraH protein [Acaryochloris marina MBIC10699]
MIICPNCLHQNADGAATCEACQTALPSTSSCPNCGASIQVGAQFCGQCGFNLQDDPNDLDEIIALTTETAKPEPASPENPFIFPDPQPPDPLVMPDLVSQEPLAEPSLAADLPVLDNNLSQFEETPPPSSAYGDNESPGTPRTQLQQQTIQLVHVQTNTVIDLPWTLDKIHMGKPNDRVPPDIDVSGFPNAEVVSRVHADIRVEGGHYFIEDVGSSNGTYINSIPLLPGNRHRLRVGDRIALGKGNLVTFLFQLN